MPETLGESTPPSATASAGAKKQKARQTQEMDIQQRSRRTAQQSREYELIWLLQQRLRAICLGLTGACAAFSHNAQPAWHGTCEALITLKRRPLSVSRALHVLSSCVLYAWHLLPLICLKLLVNVCVQDGLAASICACRTSAVSVELLPRGWRAVASPRWLQSSCLKLFDVAHCHSHGSLLLRRFVCTRQACCLFARVALPQLPLSLFLGVCAPSLSLVGFMF